MQWQQHNVETKMINKISLMTNMEMNVYHLNSFHPSYLRKTVNMLYTIPSKDWTYHLVNLIAERLMSIVKTEPSFKTIMLLQECCHLVLDKFKTRIYAYHKFFMFMSNQYVKRVSKANLLLQMFIVHKLSNPTKYLESYMNINEYTYTE